MSDKHKHLILASVRGTSTSRTWANSSLRKVCVASNSFSAGVNGTSCSALLVTFSCAFFFLARSFFTCRSHSSSSKALNPPPLPPFFLAFFFSTGLGAVPPLALAPPLTPPGENNTPLGLRNNFMSSSVIASALFKTSARRETRYCGIFLMHNSKAKAYGFCSSSSSASSYSASKLPAMPPRVLRRLVVASWIEGLTMGALLPLPSFLS
mmetsp:Transcript_7436/g.16079  ORF Transcript_7436/g.16079 Transcript_7436/m.16079 type:complete len:209 (+) Transcript_7436:3427-4053(+)